MNHEAEIFEEFSVPEEKPVDADGDFVVAPQVWEAVMQDLGVRTEWEARVQREAEARLESTREQAVKDGFEAGRQEGLALGIAEGKAQLAHALEELEALGAALVRDKQALLTSHEKTWCYGMHYLLRRFVVDKPAVLLDTLEAWLSECIEMLPKTAQVKLRVSPELCKKLEPLKLAPASWKMESNPELKTGEVQCVFEGGEIFFSGSRELSRLETMLAELKTFDPGAGK